MKYLLLFLLLLSIIVLPLRVGKTYAVLTAATNVSVNTFYGESTDETQKEVPDSDAAGQTGSSETDTAQTDDDEAQTFTGVKTADTVHLLHWVVLTAASLAGIVLISAGSLTKSRKSTDNK